MNSAGKYQLQDLRDDRARVICGKEEQTRGVLLTGLGRWPQPQFLNVREGHTERFEIRVYRPLLGSDIGFTWPLAIARRSLERAPAVKILQC